jgi:photosystem II stability/assembly factor-like uncharacterized protein
VIPRICLVLILSGVFIADACAAYGLFHSGDNGASWRSVTEKFATNRINALLYHGDSLWAATDNGLFGSTTFGQSWTQPAAPFASSRILSVAAQEKVILAGTAHGLWVSTNFGLSWQRSGPSISGAVLTIVAAPGVFYFGTEPGVIFRSRNLGESWEPLTNGLPGQHQIFQLHLHSSGELFAALYSKGLYTYRENRWQQSGDVRPLVLSIFGDTVLAGHNPGGIDRSTDLGQTWHPAQTGLPLQAPSWAILHHHNTIYYGTTGRSGLYVSEDAGETWSPSPSPELRHRAVVALTGYGSDLFAATVSVQAPLESIAGLELP